MNKEQQIKEITEIITRLQGCGRKGISPTEAVIVHNKDIATALHEATYRKQGDTVKEFAEKAFRVLKKLEAGYKPDSKSPCDIQPNNVFTVINIELNELATEYGVGVNLAEQK